MEYVMIGFWMSIGWVLGKSIIGIAAKVLLNWLKSTKTYREMTDREIEIDELHDDIKVVKNQIGFR